MNDSDAKTDENVVCFISNQFGEWITYLHQCTDQWLCACSNFIRMCRIFFGFVMAYQEGDSITIDHGYQQFAPTWRSIGQHRYLEQHWRQVLKMLVKSTSIVLEE